MTEIQASASSSPLFDLRCYPPEILGTIILAGYCNPKDVLNLWYSILGSKEHVEFLWPLLVHNYTHAKLLLLLQDHHPSDDETTNHHHRYQRTSSRRRRRRIPDCLKTLIQDELKNNNSIPRCLEEEEDSSSLLLFDKRRHQTRWLLQRLHLIEYHDGERLQGASVLWAGRMEFSIPRGMRFFQQQRLTASVKLCCYGTSLGGNDIEDLGNNDTDGGCDKEMNSWSFVNLRAWNMCFPEWLSVVQLRSQLYNFVPIPPYGRLLGIDPPDKAVISKIRSVLEESDQVMTLIVRNNRLILRIISPQQAKRRLEAFPSLASKFEQLADTEGLLCCWERTERWEDELKLGYTSHEEKLEAIASILTRYHHQSCRKPSCHTTTTTTKIIQQQSDDDKQKAIDK